MIRVLLIALLFFGVTVALAVGPLLMCRLFLGSPAKGHCRTGAGPNWPGLLNIGAGAMFVFVVSIGVMLIGVVADYMTRGPSNHATVMIDVSSVQTDASPETEQSLFDAERTHSGAAQVMSPPTGRLSWAAVVLPILLVTTLLAFVGERVRGNLFWQVPVVIVGVLAVLLLVGFPTRHEQPPEIVDEQAQMQARQATQLAEWEQQRAAVETLVQTVNDDAKSPIENPVDDEADADPSESESPAVIEYVSTSAAGVPRDSLPDWTDETDVLSNFRVIKSGQHATVELAEQNALGQLKAHLRSEFVKRHPAARGWQPTDDIVLNSGSILQRAVEQSQIEVGDSTYPMYAAYWQVDTSVYASLYQAWRPTEVKTRLGWLGGGIGLLTLLFGSLAAFLRVDEQTGGRRRKALAAGTITMWLAIGGALLVLA